MLEAANAIRALAHGYDLGREWSKGQLMRQAAGVVEDMMADEPADAASDAEQASLRG